MDDKIQEKLSSYLEILKQISKNTGDERTAVSLLQEIMKDLRMEQIRQERGFNGANGDALATEKQISYLKSFGAVIPEGLTRQQASQLIDQCKAAKYGNETVEMSMRVP